jgi:hypothetical protein
MAAALEQPFPRWAGLKPAYRDSPTAAAQNGGIMRLTIVVQRVDRHLVLPLENRPLLLLHMLMLA